MTDGFIKVCSATPDIKVADTEFNKNKIYEIIKGCEEQKVKLVVFPELCLTGYTCGDLFQQDILLQQAEDQLAALVKSSKGLDILCIVGLPFRKNCKLYNAAAVFQNGELLGIVPKGNIPNYSEFYEARHFEAGSARAEWIYLEGLDQKVPFGQNLLFLCRNMPDFIVGVEICEDLWVAMPPSVRHVLSGATVIANLSASDEVTGKDEYRRELVKGQSARLVCAYLYADAGEGESTTDLVFSGHNMICENGAVLAESERFRNQCIVTELDIQKLVSERRRMNTCPGKEEEADGHVIVGFEYCQLERTVLTRSFGKMPFVPAGKADREKRCGEILKLQAMGLKKRIAHTNCSSVVIGISGGLDSTLALLVSSMAMDLLGRSREQIISVTMPCFGTTDRTYQNAVTLAKKLNTRFREIPIHDSVLSHFRDIGQDREKHDITYENAQARMRTMVLMNIANQQNGMVVGTGDMSELALGWATYNGDHMSMYGVNSSVPKTLVRYLVQYFADAAADQELKKALYDVLDTPVSPELLPPSHGEIMQKTEDIVGPYELHDYFLYYMLRFGFAPSKIYRMAAVTFQESYPPETILHWLTIFYKRFFSQQFKRSCLPDGPKVGSVAVSPRGDLRMPSDACVAVWLEDLKKLKE